MTELEIKIKTLREEGKSYGEIATELGCSKSTVSYHCGKDQKIKTATRTRDQRNKIVAYIQEYKSGKACMDCGQEYPYFVMDFDHRPGEKKLYTIGNVRLIPSLDALKIEIAKCDLVCANCHRFRT